MIANLKQYLCLARASAKGLARATAGGFTLIETLLAVLLLTVAIAGPLSIASQGLLSATVAKDQITAFYLAQDAMEHVRFLRDSACLAATPGADGCPQSAWLADLGDCTSTTGAASCTIDSIQNTICPYGTCSTILKYNPDPNASYFSYTTGNDTPQRYTRSISIQHDPSGATPDEAIVTVTVTWQNVAGITRKPVTIRENIFRWQ